MKPFYYESIEKIPANQFWVLSDAMKVIAKYCAGAPTCEGCGFWKEKVGCQFRGRTPREWL